MPPPYFYRIKYMVWSLKILEQMVIPCSDLCFSNLLIFVYKDFVEEIIAYCQWTDYRVNLGSYLEKSYRNNYFADIAQEFYIHKQC